MNHLDTIRLMRRVSCAASLVFLVGFGVDRLWFAEWAGMKPEWDSWVLMVLAVVLAGLEAERLPLQNVLAYSALLIGFAIGGLAVSGAAGVLDVSRSEGYRIPVHWVALVLSSRAAAQALTWQWHMRRHHGWRVLALHWILLQCFSLWYVWHGQTGASDWETGTGFWVGFGLCSALLIVLGAPLLLDKRLSGPSRPALARVIVALLVAVVLTTGFKSEARDSSWNREMRETRGGVQR